MRRTHSSLPEVHGVSALTLVFALALGGCHADIARVEGGDTDGPVASQLLPMDTAPSCYFGSAEYPEMPSTNYWGFVYTAKAPEKQVVDLVGGVPLTHHQDVITWVCTGLPSPPTFELTADDPAELAGFSWEWHLVGTIESTTPASWPRVLYEGDLPSAQGPFLPPPGHWRNLVVQLRDGSAIAPLARATLGVDVCGGGWMCPPSAPPPGG